MSAFHANNLHRKLMSFCLKHPMGFYSDCGSADALLDDDYPLVCLLALLPTTLSMPTEALKMPTTLSMPTEALMPTKALKKEPS